MCVWAIMCVWAWMYVGQDYHASMTLLDQHKAELDKVTQHEVSRQHTHTQTHTRALNPFPISNGKWTDEHLMCAGNTVTR